MSIYCMVSQDRSNQTGPYGWRENTKEYLSGFAFQTASSIVNGNILTEKFL